MKTIFFITFLSSLSIIEVEAQNLIKKIIYDDLLALNDMYNGHILSQQQYNLDYTEKTTLNEIKKDFMNRVLIVNIDSSSSYYFVKVKFALNFSPIFNHVQNDTFDYVLYKYNRNILYKVNGFLVSEILSIMYYPSDGKRLGIKRPRRFRKHLYRCDINKIQDQLSISVIKKLESVGLYFVSKPYIKDTRIHIFD